MAEVIARGVSFHVQRLGRGGRPFVVFLHGLVMDNLSSWYFTVATRAAADAEVLLFDLRGHGRSARPAAGYTLGDMVADLGAVLDAADVSGPVELVGNSFGGLLALAFAAAHPERVAGLALIDAHHSAAGWGDRMAATLELEGAAADQAIRANFQSWLGRHSQRKRTRLAEGARGLVQGTSLVADLRRSRNLTAADLVRVRCPALLLYGEDSDVLGDGRLLAESLPDARLDILPGCTHSVLWEAPDLVRERVLAWLHRDPSEQGG